jgi:endo-1,4-beta-xylanase
LNTAYRQHSNDIQEAAFGTDDREFLLRAERSGLGNGRVYTITYQAKDASGNTTVASTQVVVPHDRR